MRPSAPAANWWTLAAAVALASLSAAIGFQYEPHIVDEDGVLENLQVLLLVMAVVLHGLRAARQPRESLGFLIHAGLSVLSCAFLLRELDIREWDAGDGLLWHRVERVARVTGVILLTVFALYVLPRMKQIFALRMRILRLPVILQALCAAVLLVSGWPFDNGNFDTWGLLAKLVEETFETNGYLVLMACSAALSDLPEWRATASA